MLIKITSGGCSLRHGASVRFCRRGEVVEASDAEASRLIRLGGAVPAAEAAEERPVPPVEESPPKAIDYSKLTKARLLELCETRGIDASAKLTKAELCVLLVDGELP